MCILIIRHFAILKYFILDLVVTNFDSHPNTHAAWVLDPIPPLNAELFKILYT